MTDSTNRPAAVWVFDVNRRVYASSPSGRLWSGGPIWREHWRREAIVSETRRSWITEMRTKVPKTGADPARFAFSEREIAVREWVHDHRHQLARAVGLCNDARTLHEIARLLGYTPNLDDALKVKP